MGGNPGKLGREVNGKREKTERDAGVVRGRDAGEECRTLRFFSDFFVLFKLTIKNIHFFLVEQGRESGDNRAKRYGRHKGR